MSPLNSRRQLCRERRTLPSCQMSSSWSAAGTRATIRVCPLRVTALSDRALPPLVLPVNQISLPSGAQASPSTLKKSSARVFIFALTVDHVDSTGVVANLGMLEESDSRLRPGKREDD